MLGHQGSPTHLVLDSLAKGVRRLGLAMHHIDLRRSLLHALQPIDQLGCIRMCRGRLQLHHFGFDLNVFAVYADYA
jgi:hypothetical protein